MLSQLEERLKEVGSDTPIKPYRFRMAEIEGFRYRVKVRLEGWNGVWGFKWRGMGMKSGCFQWRGWHWNGNIVSGDLE